jgi:glutamate--cysteine ligase catalytic subunit
VKQLLAIWNKAKGKERDALLWGDEVGFVRTLESEMLTGTDRIFGRDI